jgi:hypothetical protein
MMRVVADTLMTRPITAPQIFVLNDKKVRAEPIEPIEPDETYRLFMTYVACNAVFAIINKMKIGLIYLEKGHTTQALHTTNASPKTSIAGVIQMEASSQKCGTFVGEKSCNIRTH